MLLGLLAGCVGEATVTAPTPTGAVAQACATLVRSLPQQLRDEPRRQTRPESPYVAAWGDPAIVLRCGVDLPASYQGSAVLSVINDVSWLAGPDSDQLQGGATFTTLDREAYVEVFVPPDYAPASGALAELGGAVAETLREEPGSSAARAAARGRSR